MKKILVINGHPDEKSLNNTIAQFYIKSAMEAGAEVKYIAIAKLDFNPNLQFGYRQRMELEKDLLKALEDIQWSEHQVWIHPLWWLGMPAIMKGFLDRLFLPGLTFKSSNGTIEGLLKGKTGRIITTAGDLSMDVYEEVYRSSGLVQLKQGILEYCGVSSIKSDFIGPVYDLSEAEIKEWLETVGISAKNDSV